MLSNINKVINDISHLTVDSQLKYFFELLVIKNKIQVLAIQFDDIINAFETINSSENYYNRRRYENQNLHLYYNKHLGDNYKLMCKYFNIKEVENTRFHVTKTHFQDFVKQIPNTDNQYRYIAMNFWFFERPLAASILDHELAHLVYMDKDNNSNKKITNNKEIKKIIENINESIILSKTKNVSRKFISELYQEIQCDLAAYNINGISYFYALFFTNPFDNILNFFVDDLEELSIKNEEFVNIINNKDFKCKKWIKKPININLFVRFKIMMELIEKDSDYDSKKDIYKLYVGIKRLIDILYYNDKDEQKREQKIETIYSYLKTKDIDVFRTYQEVNKYSYFIFNLFKSNFIDTNKEFRFKLNIYNKIEDVKTLVKWVGKDNIETKINNILWEQRVKYLFKNSDDYKHSGRISRYFSMNNMYGIQPLTKIDSCIYELVTFKNIKANDLICDNDFIILSVEGDSIKALFKGGAFELDEKLIKLSKKVFFTTVRIPLFRLDNNENTYMFVNEVIIYDDEHKEFVETMIAKKIPIFKSMGSCDYIVLTKHEFSLSTIVQNLKNKNIEIKNV